MRQPSSGSFRFASSLLYWRFEGVSPADRPIHVFLKYARSRSSSLRKEVGRDSKVATKCETRMNAKAANFSTCNLKASSCLYFGINPPPSLESRVVCREEAHHQGQEGSLCSETVRPWDCWTELGEYLDSLRNVMWIFKYQCILSDRV